MASLAQRGKALQGNDNTVHPANAILNSAYSALESEIHIEAISDGSDPTLGIMHEGRDSSSRFIFDLMEAGAAEGRSRGAGFPQKKACFRSG